MYTFLLQIAYILQQDQFGVNDRLFLSYFPELPHLKTRQIGPSNCVERNNHVTINEVCEQVCGCHISETSSLVDRCYLSK